MRNPLVLGSTVALLTVGAVACTTSAAHQDIPPASAGTPSSHVVSVEPADVSDASFCRALRQAGLTNTATLGASSDPATLLAALDALLPSAPPAISDDFATFDQL